MNGKLLISGLMLLFTLPLVSCGGSEVGSPGSSGSNDSGIVIQSVSIAGVETNTDKVPDVDANVHVCSIDATTGEAEFEEGLFRVSAEITILAKKLNESGLSNPPFPASVEECTITYLKANEDPSAPVISSLTFFPNCVFNDSVEAKCSVPLIDIQRKRDYWAAISNGLNLPSEYPTHYVAKYYCKYKSEFGTGYFPVEYDFWIADFNTCAK
jgi:hypothetical protein